MTRLCTLPKHDNGYRCHTCGYFRSLNIYLPTITIPCQSVELAHTPDPATAISAKVARYGQALARWSAAGFPRRSRKEQETNLAICKTCPGDYYKDNRCTHAACGCQLASRLSAKSKIAMATEECPLKLWLATHGPLAPIAKEKAAEPEGSAAPLHTDAHTA